MLRRLEEDLHRPETRRDTARMQALLHKDFEEFGRSGRRISREDVLGGAVAEHFPVIRADEFTASKIGDRAALLTYRSANVDAAGNRSRVTLRSSLWIETEIGWQMRFHQGTPINDPTKS